MTHIHGGNPDLLCKQLGLNPEEIIDFSVNISPYGVPDPIKNIWSELSRDLLSYPTPNGQKIKELFADQYGISPDNILPGNGSIEGLYLLPRVLELRRIGIITPSFYDYERAFKIVGTKISYYNLEEKDNFASPTLEQIIPFLDSVDGLIFGSPNNPTGTFFNGEWVIELATKYPTKYFIVDEAFIHFQDNFPTGTLARNHLLRANICILQSLTKFYALPGIRLGALIADRSVVAALEEIKEPWSINKIAERIASMIPDCEEYGDQLRKNNRREKRRIEYDLASCQSLRLYPNQANFFLAHWGGKIGLDKMINLLLQKGLFVRDCRNFRGMAGDYFRFAIRTEAENRRLIKAFKTLEKEENNVG
jgi:threonine-phosphate decarboxylase